MFDHTDSNGATGGTKARSGVTVLRGGARRPSRGEILPEPWRWGHPRVLVEHPDEQAGLEIATGLRYAGCAVTLCTGPQELGQCPLCELDGCAAAHDADLVVTCLNPEHEVGREVLEALRARCPDVPLLIETATAPGPELEELLAGCRTLAAPASAEQVVEAARGVLGDKLKERADA